MVRVKAIFCVPKHKEAAIFGTNEPPSTLVYVELFTKPEGGAAPLYNGHHTILPDYYPITKKHPNLTRKATVVSIDSIVNSCQLAPKFTKNVDQLWTSENILDQCQHFVVNNHLGGEAFKMIF